MTDGTTLALNEIISSLAHSSRERTFLQCNVQMFLGGLFYLQLHSVKIMVSSHPDDLINRIINVVFSLLMHTSSCPAVRNGVHLSNWLVELVFKGDYALKTTFLQGKGKKQYLFCILILIWNV